MNGFDLVSFSEMRDVPSAVCAVVSELTPLGFQADRL
jgi:hypothetical protein